MAVVGVGLNVTSTRTSCPSTPPPRWPWPAPPDVDRGALLLAVLDAFGSAYRRWSDAGGDPVASGLHASYAAACGTVGRDVRVELPGGGTLEGVAEGVDADGRLRVLAQGRVHVLGAGDVVHARHAGPTGPATG